ncbi:hypothetical protein SANT12839_020240 [Streptomyces antimycoticus]|uniref:2-dehydropantoate 2-reductase n=1 Tax=Streptomyces antimycoticus TaxID=68175 RepID=A0A4D4JZ81_9ACTN|nr:2-dehydropantoate 2-reductase N-terminal domain-containing protein [Streptomyces antimycoticus]GDY41142.1 hypothetical protein SANT12839_020240 [Streptomyces antimycoticus]
MKDAQPVRPGYTVVGAGAIGGTLAFALARAGHPVTVVDTDRTHVDAIRTRGLVVARGGTRESVPVTATTPDEFTGTLHRVLLAVKAQATGTALDWIAPRLAPDGYVVSLQNGFNESLIAQRLGAARTVAAFVNIFADVIEPGVILDGGDGALVIGEPDGGPVSPRVRDLVAHLHSWGPAVASDNVEGYLWAKAGFGAMLAATALADAPMADLIDRHRPAMAALTGEIFAVSDRLGVTLEAFDAFEPQPFRRGADPAAQAAAFDRLTAWLRTQTKDRSGIWRDLAVRHRPVEAPTHYTEVFDHAAREGLPTPLLHTVVTGLRQLEGAAQNMSESRLDELDRLAQPPHPRSRSTPNRPTRCASGSTPTARTWSPTSPPTPPRAAPATTWTPWTAASAGCATGSTGAWAHRTPRRPSRASRPETSSSAATPLGAPPPTTTGPSFSSGTTTPSGRPAPWTPGPSGGTATTSPAPASST